MKVLYTFLKDLKISFKTFYIYIEIIMALIFVSILLFVVPENFSSNAKMYVYIDNSISIDKIAEELEKEATGKVVLLNSLDEIKPKLEKDRNSVGLSITVEDRKVVYDVVLQGYESQRYRNIIEKSLVAYITENLPGYERITNIKTLSNSNERLSDRLNILPVFLLLNSSFVGLFIVATYIFMDKEEGNIRAFAVTPAKIWEYLLSKMGVMLVTGLMTALITTIFVAGSKPNYLLLILLLIATNAFGTAVGLFIASFYDSIIKAFGAIYIVIIILGFVTVSYYMPSFSPLIVKLLPSYPMLFAFREVFLENPNISLIYWNVVGFSILTVFFFVWANHRFKKTLTV